MIANPIYEGEQQYETIDDCQGDYRQIQQMQLSTAKCADAECSNLKDNKPPLPSPRTQPDFANQPRNAQALHRMSLPTNIPMVDGESGAGLRPLCLVNADNYTVTSPAGVQSTTATTAVLPDPAI